MEKIIKPEFTFDGFKIFMLEENPQFSFQFNRERGYTPSFNILSNPEFYIYDTNCDGKAESVLLERESYKRGKKGTEQIFKKADELLAEKLEQLDIKTVRKEWGKKLGKYKTKEEYYSDIIRDM